LCAAGLVLEYKAITVLKRQRASIAWLLGPPVVMLVDFLWFTYVQRNLTIAHLVFNVVVMAVTARVAVAMAKPEDGRRSYIDMVMAGTLSLSATSTFLVILDFLRANNYTVEYETNNPRSAFHTVVAIVGGSVNFVLFLLAFTERLNVGFKHQALHDGLTNLYNRRAMQEIGCHEVAGAMRTGMPVSVFLVDLDHFKLVNDAFGHEVGDEVLRLAAETLQGCVRDADYLGRWGGDEFCVLLPGTPAEAAEAVAERALRSFEELQLQVDGHPVPLGISIGIVTRQGDLEDFYTLLKLADSAMYQAKVNGRRGFALA
jgi:diguanylate cyclase (GGDEF)-like protein